MSKTLEKSFADYWEDAQNWITLASGEYYPDILEDACWMRVQLCRVFRRYVSSTAPVEMLKVKKRKEQILDTFGADFRPIATS